MRTWLVFTLAFARSVRPHMASALGIPGLSGVGQPMHGRSSLLRHIIDPQSTTPTMKLKIRVRWYPLLSTVQRPKANTQHERNQTSLSDGDVT